ncbi:MAG: MliC family protein [Neisseria sp.]|nr:MliC family protein [Neisseria sp.]
MNKLFLGVAALCLAACAGRLSEGVQQQYKTRADEFICENGETVKIKVLNTEQVLLEMKGRFATMKLAESASGSLYQADSGLYGKGGEWHLGKRGEAYFAYTDAAGRESGTACRLKIRP